MPVNQAKIYFKGFVNRFKLKFPDLKEGQFQAMMEVSLINDGPVTIMIDSNKDFY
jgi:D-tyrosyl-tRNA(Tyr) deacylase